jgi:putative intracellular protease/amidase
MKSLNSLIITTSGNRLAGTTNKTGVWLEDLAAPYYVLKDSGEHITIISPEGGQISLDPNSNSTGAATENTIRFLHDSQAMYHLSHSLPINEVSADNFDLVFLSGRHGAMWDFADNKYLNQLLEDFNRQNKPIGLVGHAVVALVSLKKENNEPLVKDKKLTGFSNHEEELTGMNEKPPFLLESKLVSLGALYSKGPDFNSYIVVDNNIITGQNPASSAETAKLLLILAHRQQKLAGLKLNEKYNSF